MDIQALVKRELRESLHREGGESGRWLTTIIPINLWPETEWEPVAAELSRLQALGYISEIIEVEGHLHDDDDILYPCITPTGLAWLESD